MCKNHPVIKTILFLSNVYSHLAGRIINPHMRSPGISVKKLRNPLAVMTLSKAASFTIARNVMSGYSNQWVAIAAYAQIAGKDIPINGLIISVKPCSRYPIATS